MSYISLGDELETIAGTLAGVVGLLETSSHPQSASQAGALALVEARLRLLKRVVRGELDANVLAARHNTRDGVRDGEDADVLLPLLRAGTGAAPRRRRSR